MLFSKNAAYEMTDERFVRGDIVGGIVIVEN
jgi:hypothetical protein